MAGVFELVHQDCEKVILKVNAKDALTVAMNPFVSSDYEFITVTRGKKHILTVVKSDGKTFSFDWGVGGYTVISDSLEALKARVIQFIERDNLIPFEWTCTKVTNAKLFHNSYYGRWQVTFNGVNEKGKKVSESIYFLDNDINFEEAMEVAKKITGIPSWEMVHNPNRNFTSWTTKVLADKN